MMGEKWKNKQNKQKRTTAEVSILGENLVVAGDSKKEYIYAIAEFVNDNLQQINHNYPRMSRNKIMALGTMNLADQLFQAWSELEELQKKLDEVDQNQAELEAALDQARKLARHYQNEYEELALLLEKEG